MIKRWRLAACISVAAIVGGAGLGLAVSSGAEEATRPGPAAQKAFDEAKYWGVADKTGSLVGYIKNTTVDQVPPASAEPNSEPAVVYKNADGSGGTVGYLADFGFIPKSDYEAPGFNLEAAREARRAEIEAEQRKTDPNFSLDELEKEVENENQDNLMNGSAGG